MLLNHTTIMMASLVLVVPYYQDCDCEYDPEIEIGGEDNEDPKPGKPHRPDDDPDKCEDPEDEETYCRSCLRTECCEGLVACEDDADCSCMIGCMGESGDRSLCARTCSVTDITAALDPLTRYCEVEEQCGGRYYCG